jgi:hypothetical protein
LAISLTLAIRGENPRESRLKTYWIITSFSIIVKFEQSVNATGFRSNSLYSVAECRFGDIVDRSYASAGKFLGRTDSVDSKDNPRFFGLYRHYIVVVWWSNY